MISGLSRISLVLAWATGCAPPPPPQTSHGQVRGNVEHEDATLAHAAARPATASTSSESSTESLTPAPSSPGASNVAPVIEALDITDVPPPLLMLPSGERPAPLLIGAHGAGGSPEWQCEWLASISDSPTGRLCLRGLPLSRGELAFYYPEHHSLGRWLFAALERVTRAYGSRIGTPFIYVGYSQGATMGALAIQTAKVAIPHLLLVEGGLEGWSLKRSRAFAQAGGRKVYFACGTRSCHAKARQAVQTLSDAGLEARMGYADGAGHTPVGAVETYVREGLSWLLQAPTTP